MELRAVLMAGGSGTRLRPITCDLPKPMVPIANRPIIEHTIELLKQHGIRDIIITLHYLPETIQEYFGDGADFGVNIFYSVEEDEALGTAGCVKNIAESLPQTFIVISGDSLTDFDLSLALDFHRQKQSKATLVLTQVANPVEFGEVIIDDEQRITRFLEKPSPSEIFSDTVNTGIYILEPEVLDFLPENTESDFSQDLFPTLLAKNIPMYGYIADGYWCDVGHLDSYRQAQYDVLDRKIKLSKAYPEHSEGIWIGESTYIDPTVKLVPPVIIGDHCRIQAQATIDAHTIIGDNVTIANGANLKRAIIWNGAIISEEAQLRACVIGRGARIGKSARVLEGAVVGSWSTIGDEAQISPDVRVWPNKEVESLAVLNINLIWGHIARRRLFGERGVHGLANIDITPEFAVKLGAAYGSTLKAGTQVTMSRDQRSISRMVSRSLTSGLMSVGIDVLDLQATAIPVSRTIIPTLSVAGGVHVRLHHHQPDHILIEFFDKQGININKNQEKKIESAYFKEDLRRSRIPEIGNVNAIQGLDSYNQIFQKYLDVESIRRGRPKVVIDYLYAVSGAVLPLLLDKFGCDAVVLNASLHQTALTGEQRDSLLNQLGHVVEAVKASFGVQVSAHGEQLILVDEAGIPIRGEVLTALMVQLMLQTNPGSTVVVPVHSSGAVEQIARRYGGRVQRTKANPTALMEACQQMENVVVGGSGDMGFIFPELHPGFDAMFCVAKLIEVLTLQERSLGSIRSELPKFYHKSQSVRCPWRTKGKLMRFLVESHAREDLETEDGVKICNYQEDSWILILPDASDSLVHIYANSHSRDWVNENLRRYHQMVKQFVESDRLQEE